MLALTLEIVDQETNCVMDRFPFDTTDYIELITLAEPPVLTEHTDDLEDEYLLSESAVRKICAHYANNRLPSNKPIKGILRRRHRMDNLSYFVHTNGELRLMLLGIKPLACFCFSPGEEEVQQYIQAPFEPYVVTRKFLKHAFSITTDINYPVHYTTYSLQGEEWRAKAMELLKISGHLSGWNESMERMEGSLLGYTDAQNEEYLTTLYRTQNI